MIYISDLQQLISSWQEGMGNKAYPSSYKDGVMDCIYDLNQLINKSILDELTEEDAKQYLLEQDANNYFSNIEPEEFYANAI